MFIKYGNVFLRRFIMRELWKHFKIDDYDLRIDECGIQQCSPDEVYNYKVYQNFVIHYIQEGSGTLIIDNKVYSLSENEGFILKEGQQVTYYGDETMPWKYYWVGFSGNMFNKFIKSTSLEKHNHLLYPKNSQVVDTIKEICNYTLNITESETNLFWYHSKIYQLLYAITDEFPSNVKTPLLENGYEEAAIEYINSDFQKQISINQVASYIGISRSYLYKLFKKSYNISPQEYLIQKRLNKAVDLLVHTTKPINIVAKETGYEDQLHFSKSFKSNFGVSPSDFKKINNVEKII